MINTVHQRTAAKLPNETYSCLWSVHVFVAPAAPNTLLFLNIAPIQLHVHREDSIESVLHRATTCQFIRSRLAGRLDETGRCL